MVRTSASHADNRGSNPLGVTNQKINPGNSPKKVEVKVYSEFLPAIVIPTYNNVSTIVRIIEGALVYNIPVIVVNDGSTDGTFEAIKTVENPRLEVISHPKNMGKGEALKSAFNHCLEKGYTTAITIDADGQHDPAQIAPFLAEAAKDPQKLIIGQRDLSGPGKRPKKSRLLRAHSNFWVYMETGQWLSDTQTGFRAYPVKEICAINLPTGKYDFEIEVLVKFLWRGGKTATVPVTATYGAGSSSHFRPFYDFMLVAHCNAGLFFQRFFLPPAILGPMHSKGVLKGGYIRRFFGAIKEIAAADFSSPWRFAAAIGLGVFCGIIPAWGFQMVLAYTLARLLKLSRPLTLLASNISIPPMIPFLLYGSLLSGRLILNNELTFSINISNITLDYVWNFTKEYLVGSIAFALTMGLTLFIIALLAAIIFHPRKT